MNEDFMYELGLTADSSYCTCKSMIFNEMFIVISVLENMQRN